jgi:hypothetical protein
MRRSRVSAAFADSTQRMISLRCEGVSRSNPASWPFARSARARSAGVFSTRDAGSNSSAMVTRCPVSRPAASRIGWFRHSRCRPPPTGTRFALKDFAPSTALTGT